MWHRGVCNIGGQGLRLGLGLGLGLSYPQHSTIARNEEASENETTRQSLREPLLSIHPFRKGKPIRAPAPRDVRELVILCGSSHQELGKKVCEAIGTKPALATLGRYADGEVAVHVDQNLRGTDVYIIQTCTAPVNDSVMELLLTVSCAKRCGATRVTAVIPYFPYRHHRRGSPISTGLSSRFLWSPAADFAQMLEAMGVDRVISVDLQRPGQGHEACFFSPQIPVETIIAVDQMADYFAMNVQPTAPIVVISPNSECVKKARKFQNQLKTYYPDASIAAFIPVGYQSGWLDPTLTDLLGEVKDKDAVIVDEIIDTGGTLESLCKKLKESGAQQITVVASHGLFTEDATERIQRSCVDRVIVTDTLPLPNNCPDKIVQMSVADMLAKVIEREHFRSHKVTEEYEIQ